MTTSDYERHAHDHNEEGRPKPGHYAEWAKNHLSHPGGYPRPMHSNAAGSPYNPEEPHEPSAKMFAAWLDAGAPEPTSRDDDES